MRPDDGRLRVLLVSPTVHGGQPARWLRRSHDPEAHVAGWNGAVAQVPCDVVWIDAPALDLPAGPPDALAAQPHASVLLTRGACSLLPALGKGKRTWQSVM